MKRSIAVVILVFLMLLSAGLLGAQGRGGLGLPQMFGDLNVSVGEGASYRADTRQKSVDFDMAIVGKESVDGRTGYWLEVRAQGGRKNQYNVVRYLFVNGSGDISVKRVVWKAGDQPAMEISQETLAGIDKGSLSRESFDWKSRAKLVGSETIRTPAGSFASEHYQMNKNGNTYDIWLSNKVKPYGIVKMQGPQATLTLQRVLTDQRSEITETPQLMDPSAPTKRRRRR